MFDLAIFAICFDQFGIVISLSTFFTRGNFYEQGHLLLIAYTIIIEDYTYETHTFEENILLNQWSTLRLKCQTAQAMGLLYE